MIKNRRSFLKGSGTVVAGVAITGPLGAIAAELAMPEALRAVDRAVADIVASYSRARHVERGAGRARIEVEVDHFDRFVDSFRRFTGLSDRVHVENDTVRFRFRETDYLIDNRVT
jgi:hypothetical protein